MKLIVSGQNKPEQVVDTWSDVSQVFKIKDGVKNEVFGTKDLYFSGLTMGEKAGEKERNPNLLFAILGVLSVEIR